MEMRLSSALRILDALLHDRFRFFDKLAVKIDGIAVYLADCIVLAKDELGRLSVVVVCLLRMLLSLLGHLVCASAISTSVCLLRLIQGQLWATSSEFIKMMIPLKRSAGTCYALRAQDLSNDRIPARSGVIESG